jgi:adenosylhomocysteine nucleosidase
MPRVALIAALEREVAPLVKSWKRVERQHEGRRYVFFEHDETVCVCGGIGVQAARRAAEAAIALYHPAVVQSVGFAGALDASLRVGDIFIPSVVLDTRDGSRCQLPGGTGTLVTFMEVASAGQKIKLGSSYGAQAVDMEAAGVAAAASAHGIAMAATKAISDEADFEIPGMERFIDHDGRFHTTRFGLFALLRPWLWPNVARLATNSRKASIALAKHLERLLQNAQPSAVSAAPLSARRHS